VDRLTEYKVLHKHVWPEMLEALRQSGWHNYSLFMREDGLIFGYFETEESLETAQSKMASRDINTRWQEFMSPFTDANARPDENFLELEEYFHLD
jgi:L-rhamnose mutarotase